MLVGHGAHRAGGAAHRLWAAASSTAERAATLEKHRRHPEDARPQRRALAGRFDRLGLALIIDILKPASLGFGTPGMSREYDVDRAMVAWLPLAALTGTVIGSFIWGALADVYGRRARRSCSSSVMFIGTSICGAMPGFWWNVFMCWLMGMAAGGMLPVTYALLAGDHADASSQLDARARRRHRRGRRLLRSELGICPAPAGVRVAHHAVSEHADGAPAGCDEPDASASPRDSCSRWAARMKRAPSAGAVRCRDDRRANRSRRRCPKWKITLFHLAAARPDTSSAHRWRSLSVRSPGGLVNFGIMLWLPKARWLRKDAACAVSSALIAQSTLDLGTGDPDLDVALCGVEHGRARSWSSWSS